MKMRIFTAVLGTETNTFAPLPTGLDQFDPLEFTPGGGPDEAVHPFASVVRALRERAASGHTVLAGRGAFATPGGLVSRRAYETLRDHVLADLAAALPIDAVVLGLHGAMIADGYEDAEGDLLARVRDRVGPEVIVGAELDPHNHLTAKKVANADVLVCFKEYPHTDIYERAVEVVELCIAAAERRIRPALSMFDCRMISVYHTSRDPMRSFVERMKSLEGRDGILSVSLVHGFPWGDCPEMGTKILVVSDDRKQEADALAASLGSEVISFRDRLLAPYLTVDAALDAALACTGTPVVLADSADNPGGGAAGDSTFLLRHLVERGVDAALGPLWDPLAVSLCHAAGEGARLPLRIGGKISPASGAPFDAQVEVLRCAENARMTNRFGRDESAPMGDAAAVRAGNVEIVLNTVRTQAFGDVFTPLGIDWKRKKVAAVKSSQHFYAAYAPSAAAVFYVETPGSVTMQWSALPYRRRRGDLWPFVRESRQRQPGTG
jgi:microcystin degradation protein MlrC